MSFAYKCNLKGHMLIHTAEKPFKCKICNKSFRKKDHLNTHLRTHSGSKPYKCTEPNCGKKFSHKQNLLLHIRIHKGEKPFECTICDKRFADHSALYVHVRIHTNERRYACTICTDLFRQLSHLQSHMNSHTGYKHLACEEPGCGLYCNGSGNLLDHVMRHHKDQDSSEVKAHKEKINAQRRARYHNDSEYRAAELCRSGLWKWMKANGGFKTSNTERLVGCSWAELVIHLNNNTRGLMVGQDDIDIDHIRPMSSFKAFNDPVEQRCCMNWNNLQLMHKDENRKEKRAYYNADEYARSDAGKAVAELCVGWEIEFH
jgi:hypothetical protein